MKQRLGKRDHKAKTEGVARRDEGIEVGGCGKSRAGQEEVEKYGDHSETYRLQLGAYAYALNKQVA